METKFGEALQARMVAPYRQEKNGVVRKRRPRKYFFYASTELFTSVSLSQYNCEVALRTKPWRLCGYVEVAEQWQPDFLPVRMLFG